jgi:hypothetical protein
MKITNTVTYSVKDLVAANGGTFDRTEAGDIIRYWCRSVPIRSHSYQGNVYPDRATFGAGSFDLDMDGLLHWQGGYYRTDIGVIQISYCRQHDNNQFLFNVFIEADGSNSGPNGGGDIVELTDEDKTFIKEAVAKWWIDNAEHAVRQAHFFATKPWLQLEGLTVVQALCKLDELGWNTDYTYRDPAYCGGVVVSSDPWVPKNSF